MRTSVTVIMVLFLCVSVAFAQSEFSIQRYGIDGIVVVPHAENYNQIEVRLISDTEIPMGRVFTHPQERFAFYGLPSGTYYVVMNVAGFKPVRQRVQIGSFDTGAGVPIVLERQETVQAAKSFNLTVSGSIDVSQMAQTGKARKYLDEAEKKLKKGAIADALSQLESIVRGTPDSYDAHLLLGAAYQQDRRYQDAEREYRHANRLQPRGAAPFVNLASLYLEEIETGTLAQEATDRLLSETKDLLINAIQLSPDAAFAHYLLGVAHYKSSKYGESQASLRRALEMEPRLGDARLGLANLYIRMQDWSSALTELDVYLKENPRANIREQILSKRAQVARAAKGQGSATVQR